MTFGCELFPQTFLADFHVIPKGAEIAEGDERLRNPLKNGCIALYYNTSGDSSHRFSHFVRKISVRNDMNI